MKPAINFTRDPERRRCDACGYPLNDEPLNENYCNKCRTGNKIWQQIQFIESALKEIV